MINVEVCVDSIRSAKIAESAGVSRIELCTGLSVGGMTPFYSLIEESLSVLHIPVHVLIRPRGGDFLYDDTEFCLIKRDIEFCGKSGCHGVVIGILTADGEVDIDRCAELISLAREYDLSVTFHRAFDCCCNLQKALEDVVGLGCDRILTSGGYSTAYQGMENIKQLVLLSDERIKIMAGAGITSNNIEKLIRKTGITEIHGTFSSPVESNMKYKVQSLFSDQDYIQYFSDENILKEVVKISSYF